MIWRLPTRVGLLLLAAIPWLAQAKNDGPTITDTIFDSPLDSVFYFDDSNVILGQARESGSVYRSTDAGANWKKIDNENEDGHVWELWQHPYDNQRAYMIGLGQNHWMTHDQGATWKEWVLDDGAPTVFRAPLAFHGRDPKKVIINVEKCLSGIACEEYGYYTDDDFDTVRELGAGTRGCHWAVSTPEFAPDIDPVVEDRVYCISRGLYSPWPKDNRLLVSDDYFVDHMIEPELDNGRTVTGVINMAAVKKYMLAASRAEGTDELALYVTDDSVQWHKAEFGNHRIEEDAYTILESTNYSMQVDVLGSRPTNPMGFLFTSNSNGTYFTRNIDYTNRDVYGHVDFEKIQNIQGIVLVNVVENGKDVEDSTIVEKKVVSKISFNDGRTFHDLTVGKNKLHLHSVTDAQNGGRVFSSPAPGLVMGVGNTGAFLKPYEEGDLYVSDDAGLTWIHALDGAHMYEFGNRGGVLVAVDDEESTSVIRYSINHGQDWDEADIGIKLRARYLTTVPDSTTLQFLLMGTHGSGEKSKWHVVKIDFEGLHERTCKKGDFESWPARVDEDGKASCVMGHKQFYERRKADADCFVDADFQENVPVYQPCPCTKADFECDYNFVRSEDRSECVPAGPLDVPKDVCKDPEATYRGSSGWRLIPGNECTRKGGVDLDAAVDRPCSDGYKKPASGQIAVEKTNFKANGFAEWIYLERTESSKGDDETVIMRTSEQDLYLTRDHGKTWLPILEDVAVTSLAPHPQINDVIFFMTGSKTVHYSIDRAETIHSFQAPVEPSFQRPNLRFHPDYKDWLLWSGLKGSDSHTEVYYSTDRGDHWNTLARYARKCEFITREGRGASEKLIYCEQYENENPEKSLQLVSSDTWFAETKLQFPDILDFATMSEFIIVAAKTEDRMSLKVDASVDGQTFAAAEFPRNFQVAHQQAYTVLDSSTHAVFLHVTVNAQEGREYGTIIKSNSNGTSYVLSVEGVNRDGEGYVDFEKMQGLEGVALINVVSNIAEMERGEKKRLKSMITHNDGAEWSLLPPPQKDTLGNNYKCVKKDNVATDACSLHVHSYTERRDKGAMFSSSSAIGIMMAVGNVGDALLRKEDEATDTFITTDAGVTWRSVKKGSYMWEFGDQGSIIVIVEEAVPTKVVYYTLDEGQTWMEYQFSDVQMQIQSITTVPSDMSRNFLLWGKEVGPGSRKGVTTVNLDFTGLNERQRECDLSETVTENDDYYLWEPQHPMQADKCLFGHVAQYHRKKNAAQCYNGRKITHLHNIAKNCTCTRQDFECDYNYESQPDGTCSLVPGLQPKSHEEYCAENPNAIEYYAPTGYRRIPLTTCHGGRELDKIESKPCPGHEGEYSQKHGLSGAGLFFAIVVPILVAVGVGYWVYKKWLEGWMPGFGQIRLGDGAPTTTSTTWQESPFITVPVAIIAGTWAVAKAVPLLAMSLWRSARGYVPVSRGGSSARGTAGAGAPYTSRGAFAARRQDYSSVVADEDELLGEDDEEGEVV